MRPHWILALPLLLAACGPAAPDAQPLPPSVEQPREVAEGPVKTVLAYIRDMDMDDGAIAFDDVEWLSGDAAAEAAFADGACERKESCAPGGFYVRNAEEKVEAHPLAQDVHVLLLKEPDVRWLVHPGDFASVFGDASRAASFDDFYSGTSLAAMPYEITTDADGTVISVAQQYLP